ncbi:MAG: gliding motility protein GldN [Bacteroidales bacterium]|nr:gliding motility protein GldN [Bacteroidales bacterium]
MYRKKINGILIICTIVIFGMTGGLNAQNKPASSTENPGSFSEVSFKKSKVPESQLVRGEDILWKRDVYRMIDLKKGQNGALYYPVEPIGDQMNLFSLIFDLVANNKVTAYEYIDGREIFTDTYAIKFKDLLKRFEIPYREKNDPKKANASIFEIDAVDIPSSEVTLYYVKEMWYLDQRNSTVKARPMALCPILVRDDEMGETRTYPMFWIPFESLKPYLSQVPVSADSLNSATRLSAYDYFNQRRYEGDIYKVSNLKNQTIMQYCKTPEAIKAEQERLEKELSQIGTTLWETSQKQLLEEANLRKAQKSGKTSGKK